VSDGVIVGRRAVVGGAVAIALVGLPSSAMAVEGDMYGMIGRMIAKPGQRDALAALLTVGSDTMPGCLSYVVAEDLANADALWVTEVWENKAAHDASLTLPVVREAIAKGRPLIAEFDSSAETRPISGVPVAKR
jgi:quinol monooxygenase YgiN